MLLLLFRERTVYLHAETLLVDTYLHTGDLTYRYVHMYRETIVHYCTVKGSSLPARKLAKNLTDLSTRRLSSYSGQRFLVVVEGF